MRTLSVTDNPDELRLLAKQLVKSKRVAFLVGAGISTSSGIPDFRSASSGLFASLKDRNPEIKISSGKELFHSNLFQVRRHRRRRRRQLSPRRRSCSPC